MRRIICAKSITFLTFTICMLGGEKGQIVIPKKARDIFDLHPGDQLLVLGDEQQGIALVKASQLQQFATDILKAMRGESEE